MIRTTLAALAVALTACTPGTSAECIAEYGAKAATKGLVRAAYNLCPVAFNPSAHPVSRERALCVVRQIPEFKTDAAFYAAQVGCDAEHPTPPCPAGETFSLANGKCERPIIDPFDPG